LDNYHDKFLGILGPIALKSETMDWDDCGCECEAFEMEEIQTVTYKPKKK
jgi:hypothetical protein